MNNVIGIVTIIIVDCLLHFALQSHAHILGTVRIGLDLHGNFIVAIHSDDEIIEFLDQKIAQLFSVVI